MRKSFWICGALRKQANLTNVAQEAVEYLISQLPDGYALDDENRVVRLEPGPPGSLLHFRTYLRSTV